MTGVAGRTGLPGSAFLLLVVFRLFPTIAGAAGEAPEKVLARRILEAAGTRGGLVVQLGCGDGRLTAALGQGERFVVCGLDRDTGKVDQARRTIQSLGVYGKISIDHWDGQRLPFADNMVNLLVSEQPLAVPSDEILRVLVPRGVAYVKSDGKWTKTIKPRPRNIDEWTHNLHGPDNNAVAQDAVVGPPRRLQWVAAPKFARAHEQLASLSACVSAAGRIFYLIDETPPADIRFPSSWFLVARDAFNGVLLWKRPVPAWADQLRRFRSGPADLPFRLVAKDNLVYATLGVSAPVSALDAATGETRWICEGTEHTRQILRVEDKLIMLVDTGPQTTREIDSQIRRGVKAAPGVRFIVLADASTGRILRRQQIRPFVHPALAAQDDCLFYHTSNQLVCLDTGTGNERWKVPVALTLKGHEVGWESPTLVVRDEIVCSADFKQVVARSVEDGRELWTDSCSPGYNSPPDILVIGELVWTKGARNQRRALDALTGELKQEFTAERGYMHARCYRNKATDRFILLGNQGVQLLDVKSGETWVNYWIRGTCQYGVLPANGLLYVPPDSCACNLKAKLNGFWALATGSTAASHRPSSSRLEKGPAYGQITAQARAEPSAEEWPTHRHDPARSGIATTSVPADLGERWRADLGGRLSGITAALGKVFVASADRHTVHALNGETGATVWSYTAGGRVDSPPTIHKGMALFGSADGWVYALRASDGKLAWRFRAAPEERRVVVKGQLESVWPVHGSVLVRGDELIVTAGRSSYIDAGIHLYRLDPETGREISRTVIHSPDPETGKQPGGGKELRGVLSDILVAEGSDVYMRHAKLDLEAGSETGTGEHLFCPVGLLDDTWWHRGYWVVHDQFLSHWSGWWKVGNSVPSGRILCYDASSVFGFGRDRYPGGNTGQWQGGEKYQLFACSRDQGKRGVRQKAKQPAAGRGKAAKRRKKPAAPAVEYRWTQQVPLLATAMVVADKNLFLAGPPDLARAKGSKQEAALALENPEEARAAWEGKRGGILQAASCEDGRQLAQYTLDAPPVFDGMIAANGKLYLSLKNGMVVCRAKK